MGKVEEETRSLLHFEEQVQEEVAQPQSKTCFERNHLMEVQKEETV